MRCFKVIKMKVIEVIQKRLRRLSLWINSIVHFRKKLTSCLAEKSHLLSKLEEYKLKQETCEKELEFYSKDEVPETSGEITIIALKNLMKPHTKELFLSDGNYKLVKHDSMVDFLKRDRTDRYKYVMTYFDCDDFSFRLMGQASTPAWGCLAFGIAWSKSHAFNIFVSSSKKIYIIEPQTDKLIKIEDAKGAYSNLQLVII